MLVIRGALDDRAPELTTRALYDALGGPKAYVIVSGGSHELVYEKQHTKLLQVSAEWLRSGTYEGRSPGSIEVIERAERFDQFARYGKLRARSSLRLAIGEVSLGGEST